MRAADRNYDFNAKTEEAFTIKAIILAAGYATRLYPLTKNVPKSLLPINGKPVLNYIFDEIEKIDDIDQAYIVSNSTFANHFKTWAENSTYKKLIEVIDDGAKNESERKGAVGDIQFVLEYKKIDDDIFIIAGDNYFTYSLRDAYAHFIKLGEDCACAKRLNNPEELKQFGVAEIDSSSKIIGFDEKPLEPKSDLVVYATYFMRKSTVPMFSSYLQEGNSSDNIGSFIKWLCERKDVYAYIFNGECYDIGTRESYDRLQTITTK
ncbi:MAG: nucleotidyltransferase family protein [Clostridiales bacterium]|jgi:glucose-1-phosphate thymidylyltransferase|nr:nucleotidyltransferase family protein [Clostridiales bacterium]